MENFEQSYFQDKVVWLVGGSSGIGRAMALKLVEYGAIVIVSARNQTALKELQSLHPSRIQLLNFDLLLETERQASIVTLREMVSAIDIFVYSSGVTQRALGEATNLATVRSIMEVNFFGAAHLSTLLLQEGLLKPAGHLVMLSSVVAYVGTPKRSTYAASKHALHGYFNSLRAELSGRGFHVTLICPGYVATGIDGRSLLGDGRVQQNPDTNRPRGLNVDIFAVRALRAVAQKKAVAMIGGKELIVIYLQRFFPNFVYRNAHKFSPDSETEGWARHQFLENASSRLHYRISKDERDHKIILIPGLSSPMEVFFSLFDGLEKKGFQVLSFDFPGRGLSTGSARSMEDLSSQLETLLKHIGWLDKKWDIVGFSWGVGLASSFALKHSRQVKGLTFIAPVGMTDSISLGMKLLAVPFFGAWIAKTIGRESLRKDFLKGFDRPEKSRTFIEKWMQQNQSENFVREILASMREINFNFEVLFAALGQQDFPLKVIASSEDHKLHPRFIPKLKNLVPGLRVTVLNKGKHMLPLENVSDILENL